MTSSKTFSIPSGCDGDFVAEWGKVHSSTTFLKNIKGKQNLKTVNCAEMRLRRFFSSTETNERKVRREKGQDISLVMQLFIAGIIAG